LGRLAAQPVSKPEGVDAKQMPNQCPAGAQLGDPSAGPAWNGWGADASNSRFQSGNAAQIPADQVPRLKLKWAFGFPGAKSVFGQPTIAAGRVYVGVDTGYVYALDAATGCVYWSFQAEAGVRTAVMIDVLKQAGAPRYAAYFGDLKATTYALDAATGELIWKVKVDEHPRARLTGAPRVFEGRLFVPVASAEEGAGSDEKYPCCSFRGSVVALDAATGRQIWKTYMIAEEPKIIGKNANGTERWAPGGAGVWNSPTIDPKRRALYVGTGDAYTEPAATTTDAIVALSLDSGKILWVAQDTENDAWLGGCTPEKQNENCPKDLGPDHDYGSPPILVTLPGGRSVLVAGQKSGNVWGHDPDNNGKVLWRTALVRDTTKFGGKIIWGGAVDDQSAYFGLGTGGIAAVQLKDGERRWFAPLDPAPAMAAHVGHDGPLTAIPGVVFSGGWDGVLRALSASSGGSLWEFNTVQEYKTVNGVAGKGGSMGAAGPTVAGGMVFVGSGYIGVKNGMPGNVLLAFSVQR
jgi:polyvinyl alcohol dehydrogenase (cytochrome)